MSGSHVVVEGDLLSDPQLTVTASDVAVATFRIAAGLRIGPHPGDWEDADCWVEIVCFREIAENVTESLRRGQRAVVIGRLSRRSWESENGPCTKLVVRAVDIAPSLRKATATVVPTLAPDGGSVPTDAEPLT